MTIVDRLWGGNPIQVRSKDNPDIIFTIKSRELAGVRGFGCVPRGKRRVTTGYMIMNKNDLENWLDALEEVIG